MGWRRWSSADVPLERILQDQEKTSKFSLSQEPLEEIKKKEIILVFNRSPSQYLSFQYRPRQKNEKRPYFVGGGDGAGSRVEKAAIVFWLGAYHDAAALG
jgi:hypothetical protein